MEERRKSQRFPIALIGRYSCAGDSEGECALIDISTEGTRIKYHADSTWNIGAVVTMAIKFPPRNELIQAAFSVKWNEELDGESTFNYSAGGALQISKRADKKLFQEYVSNIYSVYSQDDQPTSLEDLIKSLE